MIVDLIKNYTQDTTTIASFSVGTFTLDCQLEESHESNLVTTENPMESGALSSDHSYLEPKRYAVRGIVVSYEPFNAVRDLVSADRFDRVNSLPLPPAITQNVARVNRIVGQALGVASQARKLAPWLPSSLGWLGDQAPSANRYEKIYSDLLSIQASEELLTVTSGLMTYNNMQLVNVVARRGTDDSVDLSLGFKEVHVVETRTVRGLVVNVPSRAEAPKTGRSADQAAKPKAKGRTTPTQQTEQKKQSVLKGIFG